MSSSNFLSSQYTGAPPQCAPIQTIAVQLEKLRAAFPRIGFELRSADEPIHASETGLHLGDGHKVAISGGVTRDREMIRDLMTCMLPAPTPCFELFSQLQVAKTEWQFIVDRLPVAMFLLDEHLLIHKLNKEAALLIGAKPKEVIGKQFPVESVGGLECLTAALPTDSLEVVYVTELSERFFEVHIHRLDRGRGAYGFILTRCEITHEVMTERRQLRSARLAGLGEVSMGLAHELNNPLGVIWVANDALRRRMPMTTGTHQYLDMIQEEVERCRRLTHALLDFGRLPDRGFDWLSLKTIFENIPHRLPAGEDRVRLDLLDEAVVLGNADDILRLGINLVENALAWAHPDTDILVHLWREGNEAMLTVSNEGEPVPADMVERLFHPFVTKTKTGTGLGLSFVAKIVEMMNGHVWHQHESGRTTFFVRIPLAQEFRDAPSPR
jgi:signal transduction histidine kinase